MVTRSRMWPTTSSDIRKVGTLNRSARLNAFTVRSNISWTEFGVSRDGAVVAVRPEPALEHVALRRPRRLTRARAAPLDVDDDARRLGHGRVADVLHHQREPRTARGGHGPCSGPGGADHRGDAREFVLHGYEDPADLWEPPGHGLCDLGRRRDRVAAEEPAPGGRARPPHRLHCPA